MVEIPEKSPLRELGTQARYRGSGSHISRGHRHPSRAHHRFTQPIIKETLPDPPPVPSTPVDMPRWGTAECSFDQEHAYEAHIQRMASSSRGKHSGTHLRRQNAVRSPFSRVRQSIVRFCRRRLLRKASNVSFHFSKAYLSRNPSFVITPDISTWNMKFRKRDLIKKRPRPLSWQSARPVKVLRGTDALAKTPDHHASEALRAGLAAAASSGPLDGPDSRLKSEGPWTKVSLPIQPGYLAEPMDNAPETPVAGEQTPQRKVSGPRPPPGTQSPTPLSRGIRGPRPQSSPPIPIAVSNSQNPIITSAPAPGKRYSALLPRGDNEVGFLALQRTEAEEPVDVSEAMEFVNAWSTYLRRAIAQRAVLRRMIETEDTESQIILRNRRESDQWGSSVWSESEQDSESSDSLSILEQSFLATPSQRRIDVEENFGIPGPLLATPTLPFVEPLRTSKRASHMSTLSDMSLGHIEEVERVPTFRSITARYSHLFANHGIREINTTWLPNESPESSAEPEPQPEPEKPRPSSHEDEGMWVSGRLKATRP